MGRKAKTVGEQTKSSLFEPPNVLFTNILFIPIISTYNTYLLIPPRPTLFYGHARQRENEVSITIAKVEAVEVSGSVSENIHMLKARRRAYIE